MKILFVYVHPELDSFNHTLKEQAVHTLINSGYEVKVSDLYAMHFKASADWQDFLSADFELPKQYGPAQKIAFQKNLFRPDIKQEQEKLLWCDALILQFPLWWFSMPGILKGWFDRVFAAGFAYDKGQWFDSSPLHGKRVMLAVTTQAPESSYSENGLNGDILKVLYPIHHTLRFVGFSIIPPFIAYGVMGDDELLRKHYIKAYCQQLLELPKTALLTYPSVFEYDEKLILKK